ncbi:MAG: hypothetical protein WC825_05985 [Gallionellaceae bacterium]|jgi:hypothetical protein
MKIDTQTIPPELAAAYAKLISRKPTLSGSFFIARTKPAAHKPLRKKGKSKHVRDIEKAVDEMIKYLTIVNRQAPDAGLKAQQVRNIKQGIFEPRYWTKCKLVSEDTLVNYPTSGPFIGARNYAYPDVLNMPSTPVYGNGVLDSGGASYYGETVAGVFSDVELFWLRLVFELQLDTIQGAEEPVFLKVTGTIFANADQRPSRAMLSVITKNWLAADTSARLTTLEPPTAKPSAHIYRYITPRGAAPYFSLQKPYRVIKNIRGKKYEEQGVVISRAVVLVAPMPMMGYRFNNNTMVSSSMNATTELWQLNKCSSEDGTLHFTNGSNRTIASITHNTGAPYNTAMLPVEMFSIEGGGIFRIAKPVINGVVSTDATTWRYLSGGVPASIKLVVDYGQVPIEMTGNRGVDRTAFTLGVDTITFNAAPDRAAPTDDNHDNIYNTCVLAIDAGGNVGNAPIAAEVKYFYNVTRRRLSSTMLYDVQKLIGVSGCPTFARVMAHDKYVTGDLRTVAHEYDGLALQFTGYCTQDVPVSSVIDVVEGIGGGGNASQIYDSPIGQIILYYLEIAYVSGQPAGAWSYTFTQLADAEAGQAYSTAIDGLYDVENFTLITDQSIWPLTQ